MKEHSPSFFLNMTSMLQGKDGLAGKQLMNERIVEKLCPSTLCQNSSGLIVETFPRDAS